MSVAQTSIEAYHNHQKEGKVGHQAIQILTMMELCKDYSRRELAAISGIDLSSICGRVNELLQLGMLKEGPKRKCKATGKTINPVFKNLLF